MMSVSCSTVVKPEPGGRKAARSSHGVVVPRLTDKRVSRSSEINSLPLRYSQLNVGEGTLDRVFITEQQDN